jgi:hypothetical protein
MDAVALCPTVTSSRLGFGCGRLMQEPRRQRRQAVLARAFEEGIRHFDVARMYGLGAAERELGRFAKGRKRESLVIATKFGIEAASAPSWLARAQGPARRLIARYPALRRYVKKQADALYNRRYDPQAARASLEQSLRELDTDYVDVFFLHDPPPGAQIDTAGICAYLQEARQAGYIRAWGVAGEQAACLPICEALPGSVPQVRDDIFARADFAAHGPLITFGVLAHALERVLSLLSGDQQRLRRWSEVLDVDCSAPQAIASLLLRDALSANGDGVVLYSTTRPAHLDGLGSLARPASGDEDQLERFRELLGAERILSVPIGRASCE